MNYSSLIKICVCCTLPFMFSCSKNVSLDPGAGTGSVGQPDSSAGQISPLHSSYIVDSVLVNSSDWDPSELTPGLKSIGVLDNKLTPAVLKNSEILVFSHHTAGDSSPTNETQKNLYKLAFDLTPGEIIIYLNSDSNLLYSLSFYYVIIPKQVLGYSKTHILICNWMKSLGFIVVTKRL